MSSSSEIDGSSNEYLSFYSCGSKTVRDVASESGRRRVFHEMKARSGWRYRRTARDGFTFDPRGLNGSAFGSFSCSCHPRLLHCS